MTKTIIQTFLLPVVIACGSCSGLFIEADPANTPQENFDYLWNDINDRYSYLQYKGLDWESIRTEYEALIREEMTQEELFSVLAGLLNELRDGHVNLTSPFNVSNYFPIFLGSPQNYDGRLVLEHYLLRNPEEYFLTGSLSTTILDTMGLRIGYIRYASFANALSSSDMNYVISRFLDKEVDGVIVDVRNNGGGDVSRIFTMASPFTDQKRLIYFSQIKTGPGAGDFGDNEEVYLDPSGNASFTGRIAVLTNRSSYSATSLFTLAMRSLPYVRIIGDSTGGGLGAPSYGELPNGWTYRFSVTRTLSPAGDNWEDGIPANILVDLDAVAALNGFDSIIERAVLYIKNGD